MAIPGSLLCGDLVYLTAQDGEKHAEVFASWTKDSEFLRLAESDPVRPRTAQYWKDDIAQAAEKPSRYPFAIHTLADDRLIGDIALGLPNWPQRDAWAGIGLGRRADWGRGYGSDAMRLLLRYAFAELDLNRVSLSVFDYNRRALRSYLKVGFEIEGRRRDMLRRDGQRWDLINMGILRGDWLGRQAQPAPKA